MYNSYTESKLIRLPYTMLAIADGRHGAEAAKISSSFSIFLVTRCNLWCRKLD